MSAYEEWSVGLSSLWLCTSPDSPQSNSIHLVNPGAPPKNGLTNHHATVSRLPPPLAAIEPKTKIDYLIIVGQFTTEIVRSPLVKWVYARLTGLNKD